MSQPRHSLASTPWIDLLPHTIKKWMATYGEPLQDYLYHLSRKSLAFVTSFLSSIISNQEQLFTTPDQVVLLFNQPATLSSIDRLFLSRQHEVRFRFRLRGPDYCRPGRVGWFWRWLMGRMARRSPSWWPSRWSSRGAGRLGRPSCWRQRQLGTMVATRDSNNASSSGHHKLNTTTAPSSPSTHNAINSSCSCPSNYRMARVDDLISLHTTSCPRYHQLSSTPAKTNRSLARMDDLFSLHTTSCPRYHQLSSTPAKTNN